MVSLALHNDSTQVVSLANEIFETPFNEPLIHQVVTAYLTTGRAGTAKQKSRSEVRGGGRKPWRQKGGGRARAGTIRSPIWVGGGVTFAKQPRSYVQKINKKMYRGALKSIFSELLRQNRLLLVDDIQVEAPKTKLFVSQLKSLQLAHVKQILIISDSIENNLYLASRNLYFVTLVDPVAALSNVVLLVKSSVIVITKTALQTIEGLLAR